MSRDIRQLAFEKIASLSAASSHTQFDKSDLDRLCKACSTHAKAKEITNGYHSRKPPSLGKVPMTIREFEVLLALCKASPSVQTGQSAQKLTHQLIPYILDAHVQVFVPSPFFRKVEPSPNEALTFHVTAALLALGIGFDELHEPVSESIWSFLNACASAVERIIPIRSTTTSGDDSDHVDLASLEDAMRVATIVVSLQGFLDAASAQAHFWRSGGRLALIQRVSKLLSEPFLVAIETAFSIIRNAHSHDRNVKEWKRHLRHYSAAGRPLGAMLLQQSFAWLLVAATSLLVADVHLLRGSHVLDLLMSGHGHLRPTSPRSPDVDFRTIQMFANIATDEMGYLDASSDFIQLGSAWQQRLAFGVRAAALISYLNCSMLNDEAADPDNLMSWLEDILEDPIQMSDENLASVILRCMAVMCKYNPSYASTVPRALGQFIVQSWPHGGTVTTGSKVLAQVLSMLSHDAIITTLYTLGNVLSPGTEGSMANGSPGEGDAGMYPGRQSTSSSISLKIITDEDSSAIYGNVVEAICGIATACKDEKITALAQSILLQKLNKVNSAVDTRIITGAAALALSGGQLEFRSLLKMFARICHNGVIENKQILLDAVSKARCHISANLQRESPLFAIYWEHLLEAIVSLGDAHQTHHAKESDVELAAREIAQLLQPIAVFMSTHDMALHGVGGEEMHSLLRDAWFNIVVHGFITTTERGKKFIQELRWMAIHSPPLVAEQRGEQVESDIELNTVLRRGMNNDREAMQKKHLSALVPSKAADIRTLSYRKVIFLQSAYLVESLRAEASDCTKVLSYFLEPSMKRENVSKIMEGITLVVVDKYIARTISGVPTFSAQYLARQLAELFVGCCHRIGRVQQAAYDSADRIIREAPSVLCHRSSLFALLELLTLMWTSCLEAETDLYEPRSIFKSSRGHVTLELSDDYTFRRRTLNNLSRRAKIWVSHSVDLAPWDIKGLLQTYLSEFADDGAYGHISLGRSFAMEMGSLIPSTDQRLNSLEGVGDAKFNTASDFVAQYTTRQEYRYAEAQAEPSMEWLNFMHFDRRASFMHMASDNNSADAVTALAHIESRLLQKKSTPFPQVRDILQRAATVLCSSQRDECAIVHHLVSIPFAMFNKRSIKLGVSLWLGVMNENARMEPRILSEIAQQWELTIQRKLGLFSSTFAHPDPFFQKKEFAPSDHEGIAKRKQVVHNLLAPHSRLLQFFASHFNATRFGSPDTQRIFLRLLGLTLDAVKNSSPHPMAREIRFQIVLFGLKILANSNILSAVGQWRLKDKLLSAGLSWFRHAPRWSFGSNILGLKTEIRLLSDVMDAVKVVGFIGEHPAGSMKSLIAKEQLLHLLLENELSRLNVWVYPLADPKAAQAATAPKIAGENALVDLIRTAWAEHPSLAMELTVRFQSPRVHRDVRWLLLNFPAKAVSEPASLPLLLQDELPEDVNFMQLKYLLFWSSVSPVEAATLFRPEFQNNPFLIQYAMRALESHSSDVTFFYVPQIVQTLRYDALGYVERYILETAQFSQLFAHQIIWNMKANAYMDDDGQVPSDIKPTLDHVMGRMVDSFSRVDGEFYEREFRFFDEVTGISGKLKPLIKRSKPEKKQKIEEELRKIKVEVGVYLPSNPDGVVIGIDRKSGKPLQSHAKAPFMATFRIKKNKGAELEGEDDLFGAPKEEKDGTDSNSNALAMIRANGSAAAASATNGSAIAPGSDGSKTVEVWQSAIFKVGDDCRQDVLALQMIAAFRGIFHSVGLDVFVFPYRVTATAPGCGVIDVLPNSISRDMLGREAVNGLYDYFLTRYGNEDSLKFQQARNNFVKSMAAYSIISFLLQFKDRHNGNIMIDDSGHILHIDFGFCFDIAPGGIKFERAPFKLTTEMVAVMGGNTEHQSFKWFEELCIKAFLASRQYVGQLSKIVLLMMDSGLPCFKPESVQHFRERFVLERTEREAADFVRDLIKRAYTSTSTGLYDHFQLMTNGIPY
ncbi:phosphatidylinositol 4-kinase [Zalerion maritima]|uniref:1-phosphatidylinositol 4-kinase n=1 Tax=Zalerion maritima TaxID=339359 RepID=A0AAD5WSJ4_9PEZI|nr:phosphatidylinositol 4-kinase [Zalerion maritima]